MRMMIKAVIFDFFGVLVTEGFKQFREDYFADDKQQEQKAIDLMNQVDSGFITGPEFTMMLAKLADIEPKQVGEMLGNNKPNRQLINHISQQLKGKYKISILSNSSEDYPAQLLDKNDIDLFDDILLSYRYGIVKPQQEIYELAAKRLNQETKECVFIDDSEGHCRGATKAGMQTIYYQNFNQFRADLNKLIS